MNILEELELSKKQNNDERYEYLCKKFNTVDYAIKLEKYTIKLQQENKRIKENYDRIYNENCKLREEHNITDISLLDENYKLKDKISKIETLIINHNCDTGDIYYKYNSKFLKSELKQRILEILEDKEVSE